MAGVCSGVAGSLCGVAEGSLLPCRGGSVVAGVCSEGADGPCCAAEGSLKPCSSWRAFSLFSPGGGRNSKSVPLDGVRGSYGSVSLVACIRLDAISATASVGGDGVGPLVAR